MKPNGWCAPPLDDLGGGRSDRYRMAITTPQRAHPLVRRFYAIINESRQTLNEMEAVAGLARGTITNWRTRSSPQIVTIEAALNVLGYRLEIVPIAQDDAPGARGAAA